MKDKETPSEWTFEVTVLGGTASDRSHNYDVTVDKEYYKQLTKGVIPPVSLVERSFVFLLGKESPESILHSFNLCELNSHFPSHGAQRGELL